MSNVEAVLDTLRSMPRAEVDNVRKGINAFLALGAWGGDAVQANEDQLESSAGRRVHRVVMEEVARAGIADVQSLPYFKLRNKRDFDTKAERLVAFLRGQAKERTVQDGILRIGVGLLVKHFQRFADESGDMIVTPDMLCRNIGKVQARLDREFPGYAAVCLLHLIIRQR